MSPIECPQTDISNFQFLAQEPVIYNAMKIFPHSYFSPELFRPVPSYDDASYDFNLIAGVSGVEIYSRLRE